MMSQDQEHIEKLLKLCRICGETGGETESKKYREEIWALYSVDVSEDLPSVAPMKICGSCRKKIDRCKISVKEGKAITATLPAISIFLSHNPGSCQICCRSKGRPKRQATDNFVSKYLLDQAAKRLKMIVDRNSIGQSEAKEPLSGTTKTPEQVRKKLYEVENVEAQESESKFDDVEVTSLPLELCEPEHLASILLCSVCMGVPRHPVLTECDHIFCDSCIKAWLKNAGACPCCRSVLDSADKESLKGPLFKVYSLIKVKYVFSCVGCPEVLTIVYRSS